MKDKQITRWGDINIKYPNFEIRVNLFTVTIQIAILISIVKGLIWLIKK